MGFPFSDRLAPRHEDDLIDDAYVLRSTKKHYAKRYNGDPNRLPHFIIKHLEDKDLREELDKIQVESIQNGSIVLIDCNVGDWIVVDSGGNANVYTNELFKERFMPVEDLNYDL